MWVWIWVSSRTPRRRQAERSRPPSRGTRPSGRARSGSPSRSAGSSTWMIVDAGRLEVGDLVADRQRDLLAGLRARLVVAHERPVRIVTGPVSMPFTGLSVSDWAYSIHSTVIGVRPRHVAEEDRRPHAARAVGLHPAVLGERRSRRAARRSTGPCRCARARRARARRGRCSSCSADHALDLAAASGRGTGRRRSRRCAARARAWRISAVCGKEPIVVVGNSGRPSRSCCASRRVGERALAPRVGVGDLREPLAHRGVARARRAARGPRAPCGWPRASSAIGVLALVRARASSAATSSSFWTANAIQLSTSSSSRGSLRLSIGECCSEQEVETTTSSPARLRSSSSSVEAAAEVVDPDVAARTTTPANSVLSSGQPCSRDQLEVAARRARSRGRCRDRQPRQHRVGLADVVEVGVDAGSSARPRPRRAACRRARAPRAPRACGPRPAPARRSAPTRRRACRAPRAPRRRPRRARRAARAGRTPRPRTCPAAGRSAGRSAPAWSRCRASFASWYSSNGLRDETARTSCRARSSGTM